MRQEDFNDMMRLPWEREQKKAAALPTCPICNQPYMGDGKKPCVDCEKQEKPCASTY